ncbi:MAG: TetR/AcrR family transcriptional regulator [Myxococcota bacterium]
MTKAERTRERILQSAARLFRRHGYNGVGIDAIMKGAKLTRGGFYAHFRSKEALFVAVLRRELGFTEQLRRAQDAPSEDDARARALYAIQVYLDPDYSERIARGCTMASNVADIARSGVRARRAFTRAFRDLATEFETLVVGDDAETRALVAVATCVGAISLARSLADEELARSLLAASTEKVLEVLGY